MPTTILVNPSSEAKIRWQETYVSEGLNKKLVGIAPRGILRGGTVTTAGSGFGITVDLDPISGDAVYSYVQNDGASKNGIQVSYRHKLPIALDLTLVASTTVYLVLYINYAVSAATVAEWRTYTEAELFTAPVPEAGDVLILAKIVVPAAGPIPQSNITYEHRTDGGLSIASGSRAWEQVIFNSDFALAPSGSTIGLNGVGSAGHEVPGWDFQSFSNFTWSVSTSAPLTVPNEMQVEGTGFPLPVLVGHQRLIPVTPGMRANLSVAIRSELAPVPGAAAFYGLRVNFLDVTFATLSSLDAGSTTLSGTNAYQTFEVTGGVPASAVWAEVQLVADSNAVAFAATNLLAFDNARMWLQLPSAGEESGRSGEDTVLVRELGIAPSAANRGATLAAYMGKVLSARHLTSFVSGPTTIEWFRRQLKSSGGLGLWIEELFGGNLLLTPAVDNVAGRNTAQLQLGSFGAVGTRDLLIDLQSLSGSSSQPWGRLRFYQAHTINGTANPGWEITYNAFWDESGSDWTADDTARSAWKLVYAEHGWSMQWKASTAAAWLDSAWDGNQNMFALSKGASATQMGLWGEVGKLAEFLIGSPRVPASGDAAKVGGAISVNAKTIPSAWVVVTTDGAGGVVVDEGVNITSAAVVGNGVNVTFNTDMANANYGAWATCNNALSPDVPVASGRNTTDVTLTLVTSGGANVNLATVVRTISCLVFGELA